MTSESSERDASDRIPTRLGEHWDAQPPLLMGREHFQFQFDVAKEMQRVTGEPFIEVLKKYTSLPRAFLFVLSPTDASVTMNTTVKESEMVDEAYKIYRKTHRNGTPAEYHPESPNPNNWVGYGCFMADYREHEKAVHIHFSNVEFDPNGSPLRGEKTDARLQELHDLFTYIQKKFPRAEYVLGDSWLYTLPQYRALFPDSYVEVQTPSARMDEAEFLRTGASWGQFLGWDYTLNMERGQQLLNNLRALPDNSARVHDIAQAFPARLHAYKGPITDFYKKYGVT
ncbi:MAG: hypothetical protein WAX38_04680 [Minisyncoccia bacterium]